MDIFIDNKKTENFKRRRFKSLGAALKAVNKSLKDEDKILHSITVNGRNIPDHSFSKIKDISLIEVKTKTYRGIILEALCCFKGYSNMYFEVIEGIENHEDFLNSEERVGEVLGFLSWTYSLLMSMKDSTTLDLVYEDLEEFAEDFRYGIKEAKKALEKSDFDEFLDILEFDLGSLVSSMYHMVDEYFEAVVKEESRKSLIN